MPYRVGAIGDAEQLGGEARLGTGRGEVAMEKHQLRGIAVSCENIYELANMIIRALRLRHGKPTSSKSNAVDIDDDIQAASPCRETSRRPSLTNDDMSLPSQNKDSLPYSRRRRSCPQKANAPSSPSSRI